MDGLNLFKNASGLAPSLAKSTSFFCNVPEHIKQAIRTVMPFDEGILPVRYLGVPLISTKLLYKDCKILVEKMESRIDSWKNKTLSFAGRLQLINSVLSSMHIYWVSVFILPARIISELEKKMRNFLWNQGPMKKGKAKVKWKDVCLPKSEGGLGIKSLRDMNKALMTSHIWSILTHRNSLWVKWIYDYKLKNRSFWDVPVRYNTSWSWRKMLQLREQLRPYIRKKIGNGRDSSAWFDSWAEIGPLCNYVTARDIKRAGFQLSSSVADIVRDGAWLWPTAWYDLFPVLINIQPPPCNVNSVDVTLWRDQDGNEDTYSARKVWDTIRQRQNSVTWTKVVWFPRCIPRYAFHAWLVCRNKLKTQDKMQQWDKSGSTNFNLMCCSLCKHGPDSHDHLFFQCSYSMQVWDLIKHLAGMPANSDRWSDIRNWLTSLPNQKSARSIIGRLLFASATYYIWQERNGRLFSATTRNAFQLRDIIVSTVRMKLVTMKFKQRSSGRSILEAWKLPAM